ncbi:pur operon repressor [Limosilactobacillus sp.]|jgi:purine operon repressor|uniref:pur operon repressor n=1 Tax=Limosilactobacillus sp. TaxID=2773925 RepID=UPI0025BE4574|nr:pur operon repressor [Limosilactobacillus sp.]MCH3921991.1 pur operon repressor [Limosilactobacillus sp.]MCH3928762.1 pur operon repressor [Limosilactobacillus sp.]
MKVRRSNRLVDMTRYLMEHPRTLVSLKFFSERFGSAKSSISEDLSIVKHTFHTWGEGSLETIPGASGGAILTPFYSKENAQRAIDNLVAEVNDDTRLLPGGYVYLSDLIGRPDILRQVGRLIATQYVDKDVDVIMTVETKGIPIAQSVAMYMNKPFVIVRNSSHITEGPTVSVNYVSGSVQRIKKMELSRRTLSAGANVVVVDDFMKGGGTLNGMHSLIKEFGANLVGMTVLAEGNATNGKRLVDNCTALIKVDAEDGEEKSITARPGNFMATVFD